MKPAPIKVTRPNLETGEIIVEGAVPPSRFRPKLPTKPKSEDPQEVAAYWEAHATVLTREECRKIAEGRSQAAVRPLDHKPAWEKGDVLEVASGLTAEVLKVTWSRDGYISHLHLIDERPWFMAKTMGGAGVPWVDEHGFPVEYSDDVKEAARVDGAYTRSAAQGIIEAGEVLDEELHQRLHMHAPAERAIQGTKKRIVKDAGRLEERLIEAKEKGWDSTARRLERILKHHRSKEAKRASELAI